MLQQAKPSDLIIATGNTYSLRDFVDHAFDSVGLASSDFLHTDSSLFRPSDLRYSSVDPSLANKKLGWYASVDFRGVIEKMIDEYQ